MVPSFYRQIQTVFLPLVRPRLLHYQFRYLERKFCHEGRSLSRVTYKENVLALQRNNEHCLYTITLNQMRRRQVRLLLRTEGKRIKDALHLLQSLTFLIAFVIAMLLLRILKINHVSFHRLQNNS
ncbi:Uncharacterised protein [Streptococcus pneumoniae]|nr:Uncharacterised protein [Streptococcus pneumoniae]